MQLFNECLLPVQRTQRSHNFDYSVSAVHFGDGELSMSNPLLSPMKDPRPTIQLADFPQISLMLPEAAGHGDPVSRCHFRHNMTLQPVRVSQLLTPSIGIPIIKVSQPGFHFLSQHFPCLKQSGYSFT